MPPTVHTSTQSACTNGYTTSSKSVVVSAYRQPALNFTVNFGTSIIVDTQDPFTLRWSAAAVINCTASGSWSGAKSSNGTQTLTVSTPGTYTYTLTCSSVTRSVTVEVNPCMECLVSEEPGKPETVQPALETPLTYTQPTVNTLPAVGQPLSPSRQPDGNAAPQTMGVENTSAIIRLTYAFGGQAVATRIINGSSTLYYIHNDHLGSNSRMSTSAGSAVADSTARYTPFGDWRTEPTASLTDRGYTGHLHNNLGSGSDDLGLIYMNARYYLPSSGRFISPDTIVPDPANPQGFNRYSCVYNNPLNLIDPSGHCGGDPNNNNPFDADGNIYTDCTPENFNAMTIEQRLAWMNSFVSLSGAGGWFDNIIGILEAFRDSGNGTSGSWISIVDSYILAAIQDGYVQFVSGNAEGNLWGQFFDTLDNASVADSRTRELWGQAEQAATDYGVEMAAFRGVYATTQEQLFLEIGNTYRSHVSNPGSFGDLVSDGLRNSGYCEITCNMVALTVDQQLFNEGVNSYTLNYWYTDPRSMIGGHSVMYWSAMTIFQTNLPSLSTPQ